MFVRRTNEKESDGPDGVWVWKLQELKGGKWVPIILWNPSKVNLKPNARSVLCSLWRFLSKPTKTPRTLLFSLPIYLNPIDSCSTLLFGSQVRRFISSTSLPFSLLKLCYSIVLVFLVLLRGGLLSYILCVVRYQYQLKPFRILCFFFFGSLFCFVLYWVCSLLHLLHLK